MCRSSHSRSFWSGDGKSMDLGGFEEMIEVKNASFHYRGDSKSALDNISVSIAKGQCILCCGMSGSGKTTFTRLLNGLIPHFYKGNLEGEVWIDKKEIRHWDSGSLAQKVGSVFQNPRSQFFNLDTLSEMAFGLENMGVPGEEIKKRIAQVADELEIWLLMGRAITDLSGGEKQMIAMAAVYAINPDIFVLDEPTANLDLLAIEKLRRVLEGLKKSGKTIIIAEHRTSYLREWVDRVLLFENGKIVEDWSGEDFRKLEGAALQQRGLRSHCCQTAKTKAETRDFNNYPILLSQVQSGYRRGKNVLKNVSLEMGQGEVIGVIGHNGQGKSTLAKTLCGLVKESKGQIQFNQRAVKSRQRLKNSYLVMQSPDYQLFYESVWKEMLEAGGKNHRQGKAMCSQLLKDLDLEKLGQKHPMDLSGGEKQRLVVGTALMKDAKILIMDEPTSGLDYRHMCQVACLIRNLQRQGKIILLISHDYELIMSACTRIIEMQGGQVVRDYPLEQSYFQELKAFFKL